MKKILILLAAVLCSLGMMAETYTIVFNSNENGDGSATDKLDALVLTATNNCVESIIYANKIARAKPGFGIKGGTGSEKGELAMRLDDTYHISTMTVYAAAFVPANGADTAANKRLIIYDQEIAWEAGHRGEIRPYTLTLNKDLDSIFIASKNKTSNRWYVQKIEFEAEDPHPTQAIIETPYPAIDFGGAKWVSKDEPMEDVLSFELIGKHINGNISLSLQKSGTPFTLSETSVPANGGQVDIFYSFTLDTVAKAFPITNVVVAKAKGLDGIMRTRELAIQMTVVPPSSGGASTFDVDTTRMAIGDMPCDYYKFAQSTSDSTLKNHIGYIVRCGKRYRYGSGEKKSWDAFFHTDRDPESNEVLDMYSNNHRYFDPEHPTASVDGFDIEHMLPKSWWGGDVNPAYCDLFHLVPGDYSANRSKSNHAPGYPSDSTFNNGSFVTGSGAAYGLQRVFCPADEYKGDFARAYFYIAACYGDSLTWVTTGEPGVAMTNEGWQEFRPWLRDILLEWHRLDPVSEKEKKRAIEVNKIQGNRNPFIDYPDLVEYIWGIKQGQTVDFSTLIQSFGQTYCDNPQDVCNTSEEKPVARKEIRDGQIVIVRNASIFTLLGQSLR